MGTRRIFTCGEGVFDRMVALAAKLCGMKLNGNKNRTGYVCVCVSVCVCVCVCVFVRKGNGRETQMD